jgi:hypothetical protein
MGENSGSVSVYLLPGMKARFTVPDFFIGTGLRKYQDASGAWQEVTLENGFYVEDPSVGSIEAVANEPAVIYTHHKFSPNRIVFHSRTGEIGEVNVIAVPIHAHDSIVTGGPAYGTYFMDDETTEGE